MDLDPATLTVVGTAATVTLTEAVGFLRDQASAFLQRRRDRSLVITSSLLDAPLSLDSVDDQALEQGRDEITRLADHLSEATMDEGETRKKLDDLRRHLEAVVGRRITFEGEDRPQTGTPIAATRSQGRRSFRIEGERNITIGGDHYGSITTS